LTGLARRPNHLLHQRGSHIGHARLTFILAIREALSKGPDLCTVLRKTARLQDFTGLSMRAVRLPLSRALFLALARDSAISMRLQSGMTRLVTSTIRSVGLLFLPYSSISLWIIRSYIAASPSSACGHSMTRCTCRSQERRWLRAICLGRPSTCLNCLFLIVFPLCLSFWTPVGIDLNLMTGAMGSLKSAPKVGRPSAICFRGFYQHLTAKRTLVV